MNDALPSTKAEAKTLGLPRYFTGVACVRGHLAPRFTSSVACVVCARQNQKRWDTKNREKLRAYVAKYDAANREARKAKAREYRKVKNLVVNAATKKWRKANPDIVNHHTSLRRARLFHATPSWADLQTIQEIYAKAAQKTKDSGIQYHVDHIIPLKHSLVCGLHVPQNLQIISAKDNQSKNNLFIPG